MHEKRTDVTTMIAHPLRGMDQRWRASAQAAARARDLRWDHRDGWRDAGGYRQLTDDYVDEKQQTVNSMDSEDRITSTHWFSQQAGAIQWLVYTTAAGRWAYLNGSLFPEAHSTTIYSTDGKAYNGTDRSVASVDGPSWGPQYQVWGHNLYMVDGEQALVFDGRKADRAGFDRAPRAPDFYISTKDPSVYGISTWAKYQTEVNDVGLGFLDKKCSYRIKVTFVNDREQESPLSDASSTVTWRNGTDSRGMPTAVVPRGGAHVVARRIYRTQNLLDDNGDAVTVSGAENYFFDTEIPDNRVETILLTKPDAMLGNAITDTDFGAFPSVPSLIAAFKGTMFVATANDGSVYFSSPGAPEVYPPGNRFPLADGGGGPPTCLYATKNALVVFKARGIYLIKGDPVSGFYSQTLTLDDGAACPGPVRELPGLGAVFLNSAGRIKLLAGALENTGTVTRTVDLSEQLPDDVDDFNLAAIASARGATYHRDDEYWLAVPRIGEVYPTRVLVYHWPIGAWTYRENFPIGGIAETGDHRGYVIFGSHDTVNVPGLHVYSTGAVDKGGVWEIGPMYETAHFTPGPAWRAVVAHRIGAFCVGYGENDLRVSYTVNRQMERSYNDDTSDDGAEYLTQDQVYPLDLEAMAADNSGIALVPRYGAVVWSDGMPANPVTWRWAQHRPVTLTYDFSAVHEGPLLELQLVFTPEGRRMQLLGWEVEVTGTQRRILPLSNTQSGGLL